MAGEGGGSARISLGVLQAIILLAISGIRADNSVHILSNFRQRVTSSSLNWLPIAHYEPTNEIVIGGFEIQRPVDDDPTSVVKERALYVCRALHGGVWVAGRQIEDEKKCAVTYLGIVAFYERYDLLENVDNSARLSWLSWDKFHQIPVGAVATDTMYVARRVVDHDHGDEDEALGYTHYIGTYDSSDRLGRITYVKGNNQEGLDDSGEILVETEPKRYELNDVKLTHNRRRELNRVERILRTTTMRNTGSESALLAEALGYRYNQSIYWGQGHVMIKALNTSIRLAKGPSLDDVLWGIEHKSVRDNATTVQIWLEPGTGVNVTLRGNYTDSETPYMGQLVSVYEDGERRTRTIGGNCREETMTDVRYEFGPIFNLADGSLVPTTKAPPTTQYVRPSTILEPVTDVLMEMEYRPDSETSPVLDENSVEPFRPKSDSPSARDERLKEPDDNGSNNNPDESEPQTMKNTIGGTSPRTTQFSLLLLLSLVALNRIT